MAGYTLYFSDLCPDTAAFVAELKEQGIDYEEVNITASMDNLKRFLKLRDTRPEFEMRKLWGFIGIPVLVQPNDTLIFELNDLNGTACTLTARP
ncbi:MULTISPECIES: glutaredoxin [unclassified Gemella]|uniref:glutaredoxin n=1 Tax=unclassified Gemella TaxID=2624949 RepID=UPI0010736BF4|nr:MULTISPECIES: glutaredoxin [unclassified Gemella]MBF0710774.1 glutaredoxin [Gemella sp. GL1.1]MBF0746657.1 glutaredoxin [Gemella sp. 19428wG2_WT2a]NYS28118.1 glutaredoxin [Gemella sp. GL1]TFU60009.1 glutaredoxin [Gemella sp. WT2a]